MTVMYQEICFTDKTTKHIIMFKSGGKLFHTSISSFIDYVKLYVYNFGLYDY